MLGATAVALAAAALAGGEPFTRTCDTRVEGPGELVQTRPARDVVLGRVAFMGLRDRIRVIERRRQDSTAKVPVILRAGEPVTVTLVQLGRTRARLDFDQSDWSRRRRTIARGSGDRVVRFEGCPPDTPRFIDGRPLGDRTGYNGGFIIARAGCARLVARAPGEPTVRRKVALGVAPRRCR